MTVYTIASSSDWEHVVNNVTLNPGDIVRVVNNFAINSNIVFMTIPSGVLFNGNGFTITVTLNSALVGLFKLEGGTIRNLVLVLSGTSAFTSVLLRNGSFGTVTVCKISGGTSTSTEVCGGIIQDATSSQTLTLRRIEVSLTFNQATTAAGLVANVISGSNVIIDLCLVYITGHCPALVGFVIFCNNSAISITKSICILDPTSAAIGAIDNFNPTAATVAECYCVSFAQSSISFFMNHTSVSVATVRDCYYYQIYTIAGPFHNSNQANNITYTRCGMLPENITSTSFLGHVEGEYTLTDCFAPSGTPAKSGGSATVNGILLDNASITSASALDTQFWQDDGTNFPMLKALADPTEFVGYTSATASTGLARVAVPRFEGGGNVAPTGTNINATQNYVLNTPVSMPVIVVSDTGDSLTKVTLTMSTNDSTPGTLNTGTSNAVTSTFNTGTGVWRAAGLITDVNVLLAGLVFEPETDFASNFTISVMISDEFDTTNGTIAMTFIAPSSGSGDGLCFAAGTRIKLQDGSTLPVEELEPHMELMNPFDKTTPHRIQVVSTHGAHREVVVFPAFTLSERQTRPLVVSKRHLIFDMWTREWREAVNVHGGELRAHRRAVPMYHILTNMWGGVLAENVCCETAAYLPAFRRARRNKLREQALRSD